MSFIIWIANLLIYSSALLEEHGKYIRVISLYREDPGHRERERERERVGEYHGHSFLLAVEEGAAEAIDNIMCKPSM